VVEPLSEQSGQRRKKKVMDSNPGVETMKPNGKKELGNE
jgi:hypothetical protein